MDSADNEVSVAHALNRRQIISINVDQCVEVDAGHSNDSANVFMNVRPTVGVNTNDEAAVTADKLVDAHVLKMAAVGDVDHIVLYAGTCHFLNQQAQRLL